MLLLKLTGSLAVSEVAAYQRHFLNGLILSQNLPPRSWVLAP